MCGICGVVSADQRARVDPRIVEAMGCTIAHRGPDEEGLYVEGNVGLGSRRLSIIDLAGGKQPVHNEDRSIWVVFNGEIYNYRDLTHRLEKRGHHFYTRTDTETIVHAYEAFGDEFTRELNGMFSIALWDSSKNRLLLIRDRMGIKPLYYILQDDALIFGSELKAVLAYPGIERRVDLRALNEYLSFEYVPSPRTIFKGIRKLPPAHTLVYSHGKIRLRRYWDIDLGSSERQTHTGDQAELERGVINTLRQVVRNEMISDVPIGVLLSGGIDSSAVAALMAEASPGNIRSFSIAFDDPSFDESRYARIAARTLGIEHHEMRLTSDVMLDLIPRVAEFMDEPLGDSSAVPTYFLARFASQHVKVVLGGDGGDELFAGYSTLQAHRLMQYCKKFLPGVVRRRLLPPLVERLPVSHDNISFDFKAKRFLTGQDAAPVVRHHLWLGSFTPDQKHALLSPWARVEDDDTYRVALQHMFTSGARETINQILYCDMKLYLEGDILPKVDRTSMANSLETRVPLLNHTLVEHVSRIPHNLKLRRFTTKYILRRALRGLVPDVILGRGKKGFNMPVAKWLTGPLRPLANELFSETRLKNQGFFNPSYVQGLMREHLAGRRDQRKLLWTLLIFQLWFEHWGKN